MPIAIHILSMKLPFASCWVSLVCLNLTALKQENILQFLQSEHPYFSSGYWETLSMEKKKSNNNNPKTFSCFLNWKNKEKLQF